MAMQGRWWIDQTMAQLDKSITTQALHCTPKAKDEEFGQSTIGEEG